MNTPPTQFLNLTLEQLLPTPQHLEILADYFNSMYPSESNIDVINQLNQWSSYLSFLLSLPISNLSVSHLLFLYTNSLSKP
jgi:hypothetical protein